MAKGERQHWDSQLDGLAQDGQYTSDLGFQKVFGKNTLRNAARYVTFCVGQEVYGLSIRVIDQIIKRSDLPTTAVPRTPDFLIGIGNVKGNVIPVINLSARLGLPKEQLDRGARVLVVRHEGELSGIEVSRVLGVCPIPGDTLETAPRAIGRTKGEFIEALGAYEENKVILLSLGALLDPRDFLLERFARKNRENAA